MQCFVGGRRTGKTWQLICLSHDTGYPIVARSKQMAHAIEHQAMSMGKSIPRVVVNQTAGFTPNLTHNQPVLVDEAQGVLSDVLGAQVVAASIDGEALKLANPALGGLEEMGLIELLRTWRKEKKGKRNG